MAQNPLFNEAAFERAKQEQHTPANYPAVELRPGERPLRAVDNVMSLQGTINKTFALLALCVAGGYIAWTHASAITGLWWLAFIVALGLGIWTPFKPSISPITAPIYAICEGILLGVISATYNAQYPGIVSSAVAITFLVFFVMLIIYKTGLIKVTQNFVIGVVSATAAIAILYLVSLGLMLFGVDTSYLTSSSPLSIGLSVFICIIAALNFMLDFQFITNMTRRGDAPKFMEWYAGFGLLVTLVWLYIEILKLLAKSKRR